MISKKSKQIKSFIAMDVLEASQQLEKQGFNIVPFSLGEPDFDAPQVVKKACIDAIRQNHTKYTHSQGLEELRQAIVDHYKIRYGVSIDPEQIIVTPGTSSAFHLVFSTLIEKNDEVILPNPHYPCDKNFVEFFGGKVRHVNLEEENGFAWDVKDVKKLITPKTKAVFVTSPGNPTGTVVSADEYRALAKTKKLIISDEIYHGLTYDAQEHTALEFTDHCFVVNGFSKAFAMTGFRLGYVIAPKKFIRPMQKIQQNFNISVTTFVQYAGIAALKYAQTDVLRMNKEFKQRRDLMLAGLRELGFPINYVPQGAFYVLANAKHLSKNSYKLAFDILNEAHVAVTPGIDFGTQAEGYIRFSYAVKPALIAEGLKRLKKYLVQKVYTK